MKRVIIAGVGPGSKSCLTEEVKEAIDNSEVLIGSKRLIEEYTDKKTFYAVTAKDGKGNIKEYNLNIRRESNDAALEYGLANIKSAKKRVITSQVRAERNKAVKSRVKTYIKKVEAAVAAGDKAAANEALPVAIAEIEKAASKGIFHKNAAARKVSHITKAVNAMA